MIIDSEASHIGVLDYEFEKFLTTDKSSKVCPWLKNLGMHVQAHSYSKINWINFYKA